MIISRALKFLQRKHSLHPIENFRNDSKHAVAVWFSGADYLMRNVRIFDCIAVIGLGYHDSDTAEFDGLLKKWNIIGCISKDNRNNS